MQFRASCVTKIRCVFPSEPSTVQRTGCPSPLNAVDNAVLVPEAVTLAGMVDFREGLAEPGGDSQLPACRYGPTQIPVVTRWRCTTDSWPPWISVKPGGRWADGVVSVDGCQRTGKVSWWYAQLGPEEVPVRRSVRAALLWVRHWYAASRSWKASLERSSYSSVQESSAAGRLLWPAPPSCAPRAPGACAQVWVALWS